jgi:hypothetical protein
MTGRTEDYPVFEGGCRMDRATSATILLVASAFTACAGATKSSAPTAQDTEIQRKARGDLEQCDIGGRAYDIAVTPEGKYSFQIAGLSAAKAIVACMASKGYSGDAQALQPEGSPGTIRSGGRGQPLC